MKQQLRVSSNFDSGAIDLVGIDGDRIEVEIREDRVADPEVHFRQWFHFRIQGCAGRALTIRFRNAGACTYPGGWNGYRVCASVDTEHWYRIETSYQAPVMTAHCTPGADSLYLAYFEPYPWQRHLALTGRASRDPRVRTEDLGVTPDGHDLNAITVGNPDGKPVWIIARQHPGESMAEWYVEGLLEKLLDPCDSLSRTLLERARFHIVPNMNPDGSVRGNLRSNAQGANLNREWAEPSRARSPEVFAVRERMLETGCALFLDIHGDEALPYVFVAGNEGLPSFTARHQKLQELFCDRFALAAPDFQVERGYPVGKHSTEALKLASKWAGNQFDCLSLTLEMPFKDNANLPDLSMGWNGARSKVLGAASRVALLAVLDAD
ncbi:M14-type cytosolic carboxypeptidase [soil metagenome]